MDSTMASKRCILTQPPQFKLTCSYKTRRKSERSRKERTPQTEQRSVQSIENASSGVHYTYIMLNYTHYSVGTAALLA